MSVLRNPNILLFALKPARDGWPAFRRHSEGANSKGKPEFSLTKTESEGASTDEAQNHKWWPPSPTLSIGIEPCRVGASIVDLTPKAGEYPNNMFTQLESELGISFPLTLRSFAKPSGWHLWFLGRTVIWILFVLRFPDLGALGQTIDPVGAVNGPHTRRDVMSTILYIVACGRNDKVVKRPQSHSWGAIKVSIAASRDFFCWGATEDGHPRHLLMLAYDTPHVSWSPTDKGTAR